MLDSSDDLLDILAAPLFFWHTNRHRINGRKQRNREQEIRFLRYRRAIELHQHHYAILHVLEADRVQLTGKRSNQLLEFSEMVQFRRRHCSSFWNDLGSSFKTPRNLGVSTRSFDGQLLENSSSRMRSQGPNDRVHARVINFSSRWVSVKTRLLWWLWKRAYKVTLKAAPCQQLVK